MDAYTHGLERALFLALQEVSQLRAEKVFMQAEAKRQCDLTLDVIARHIDRMTELQQLGNQLQVLVDEIIETNRGGLTESRVPNAGLVELL